MATYKVIQDVEAEDKLVGPLTLRQFIFAGIAAISGYLGFLMASKGAPWGLIIFGPITGIAGFFAFPWGRDQPTEVWALAKLRFFLKPRIRKWDQSGTKELVTINVPKKIVRQLTNGLDQDEVKSRLNALASTIDSRGWAVKNVNVNLSNTYAAADDSDRLVQAGTLPQVVSDSDVRASDDILDEQANPVAQHFDTMINASAVAHRQQLMSQMQQSALPQTTAPADSNWFLAQQAAPVDVSPAANPTTEEQAVIMRARQQAESARLTSARLKTIKTPEELLAEDAAKRATAVAPPTVTPAASTAILNLSQNDDLDVATIARQANKANGDGEVVISLR